jgi:ketosteroid isomerase-like protein
VILELVTGGETERIVRELWSDFERDGIAGVLRWAADDASWHPHSARPRRFASTADYARHVEETTREGETVEAQLLAVWTHGDIGVARGRMRVRHRGSVQQDTRMYWLFRVRDGKVDLVSSSPDLGAVLREGGAGDPDLLQAAVLALHRDGA